MDLVKDIEEFLEPSRAKWYAHRGIPYRCGYLFHGNPGTGKTSTSVALAGHFESNLYIATLSQIHDDAHLTRFFSEPRKGDIILLEDIDSAGINRESMGADGKKRSKSKKKGVTLPGLLNAIDSISGMNGVILIMTRKNPESLDEALIRPGRIDKQVYMGPVSQEVAKSIFIRMYQEDEVPSSFLHSIISRYQSGIR